MSWFRSYHDRLMARMEKQAPFANNKLDLVWPLAIGAVFAVISVELFSPASGLRPYLFVLFFGPGLLWAGYVLSHEVKFGVRYFRNERGGAKPR